jgi:predicted  nucleic acid-binding Zn-ribbon protein
MSVTTSTLRELHRIHRQLNDLRGRLDRGPKRVRMGEATVQRLTQEMEQAKETLTRARVTSHDKQVQLKDREDKIENLKSKLNSCGSNREYQALREQIAADQQANNVLSDEILETLEQIDELQETLAGAEKKLAKANADLEESRARVEAEQQQLGTELERVAGELQHAEATLPSDFKTDYRRMTKARGEEALAQVDAECCGGCYQTLSPQTMNELYIGRPVSCKSCGCLLYLPEDDVPDEK